MTMILDDAPLVHDDALYDSRCWIVVAMGYRPLESELLEPPRSNRPEGTQEPQFVLVRVKGQGRSGKRETLVYKSLTQGMQAHGRPVRSSIDRDKWVGTIRAKKVEVTRISPQSESS